MSANLGKRAVQGLVKDFLQSYVGRDVQVGFADWLSDRLCKELPELSAASSSRVVQEIQKAVAEYNASLADLSQAVKSGQSRGVWLAGRVQKECPDAHPNVLGNALRQVRIDLAKSNAVLLGELPDDTEGEKAEARGDWNRYSVKNELIEIAGEANALSLAEAANAVLNADDATEIGTESVSMKPIEAFEHDLSEGKAELKTVVAGAVRVAANRGLSRLLPKSTPNDVIGNMAGTAVESAEAIVDAAAGKTTVSRAMDRIGEAGVAMASRVCVNVVKGALSFVPAGAIIAEAVGGIVHAVAKSPPVQAVGRAIKKVAVAAWERVKATGRKVSGFFKKLGKKIFG